MKLRNTISPRQKLYLIRSLFVKRTLNILLAIKKTRQKRVHIKEILIKLNV